MENVDVIVLSNTTDLKFYGLTQRTLNTLSWSEENYNFDIKLVETNSKILDQGFVYNNCTTILPKEPFNYNLYLNYGLEQCHNEWVVVANNDLIFTKKWFSYLMEFQKKHKEIKSLCPFEPNWHTHEFAQLSNKQEYYLGYRVNYEMCGWCIVIHRSVIEKCNLFDTNFKFWYQDNDYAETIKQAGFNHVLVTKSRVYHTRSQSHELLKDQYGMTEGMTEKFFNKWKK